VGGVARLCQHAHVPCIALAGALGDDADQLLRQGVTALACICDQPMAWESAYARAPQLLRESTANCLRIFISGRNQRV
jgi:glycerate kinase